MSSERKIVAVTGGSGLIGAQVIQQLLAQGHDVRATVRDPQSAKVEFLRKLARSEECSNGKLSFFKADLTVPGSFEEAMTGADVLIHIAAVVKMDFTECPFKEVINPAVEGTRDIARTAKKLKMKRVVFTGSVSSIVQLEENREPKYRGKPFVEEEKRFDLRPHYATYQLAKAASEQVMYDEFDGEVISILPTWTVGTQLPVTPTSSHSLLHAIAARQLPMNPLFYSSWVSAEDVAAAHVLAAFCKMPEGFRTRRYILSQGDLVSAQDFADSIRRQCKHLNPPTRMTPWPVLWLASFWDKRIGPFILQEKCLKLPPFDGSRICRELGFNYKDKQLDPVIDRAMQSMMSHGNLPLAPLAK